MSTAQDTIIPGDTCILRVPKGLLMVYLPDRQPLVLNDTLVRVLELTHYRETPMYIYQPIPWQFDPEARPDRWMAVRTYFERVV